ncbi:MAG: phosphate acetyltransferase, partial [Treponemataceae bacterium]|nr:phosphate acetyltransferase [Treponemataceae bacterium]
MDFVKELRAKAKAAGKTIVLCEGEDKRVVEAASRIVKEGIANIILLGNKAEIEKFGFDVSGVRVVDPAADANADKYAEILYKAREGKLNKKTGLPEYADVAAAKAAALKDYTMYGALILKAGDADGFVSGACHSTANTLRPGLQVIKTAPGVSTVSSCFIMVAPEGGNKYLPDGIAVFGDCAININPDENQLADIAIASADTAKKIGGIEPKIAMLSFSTKGSGADPKDGNTVEKVQHATIKAK